LVLAAYSPTCRGCFSFVCSFNCWSPVRISTLSLHDALPIFLQIEDELVRVRELRRRDDLGLGCARTAIADVVADRAMQQRSVLGDRKSTRLNSSHVEISYAVFCLKKKNCV